MILYDRKEQKFYSTKISSRHGMLTRQGTAHIPSDIIKSPFFWVEQVHGNVVLVINNERDPGLVTTKRADGLVYKKNRHEKIVLSVHTADCPSIFLEDKKHQVIGIFHSGWRGTVANVVSSGIARMLSVGAQTDTIHVYIGPALGSCCYEIRYDCQRQFEDLYKNALEVREAAVKLNLHRVIHQQLVAAGIMPGNIDDRLACTKCQKDLFTSYRREGAGVTNMISYISI